MRKLTLAVYAAAAAALFAAEAAFFLDEGSPWRRCAGLFWVCCSAVLLLSALVSAFLPFLERGFWSLPGRAWYLAAFFLPPVLILVNAGGTFFTPVDGEGLAQLAGGMRLLRHNPSLGVFSLSYYSYMARQYVLNSLPSSFLGPSLWAARVGNSMVYIASYLFFLSALASYLRRRRSPDPLLCAATCGMLVALGQYTLLNARKFEQTTMPIGVTLFFLGALLLYLAEPGPLRFVWMMWSFGFLAECYTPALGSWVLALAILGYLVVGRGMRILAIVGAYGTACLYVAYRIVKNDDAGSIQYRFRLGLGHGSAGDWALRYLHSMRATIGSDFSLVPAPLALALFAAVCLAWRYRDYRYGAVCVWAVAVLLASVTTFGSNLNIPYFDVHRTMIILPPLALGATLLLARFMAGEEGRPSAGTLRAAMKLSMVYMVFTGTCTVFLVRSFLGSTIRSDFDEVVVALDDMAAPPARVYLVPPLDVLIEPALAYYAPGAAVIRGSPPPGERIPGTYVFSYLSANPADRIIDQHMPVILKRPFIRMAPE
jgi:hypothetical protein